MQERLADRAAAYSAGDLGGAQAIVHEVQPAAAAASMTELYVTSK
jgi:hypothetical protein